MLLPRDVIFCLLIAPPPRQLEIIGISLLLMSQVALTWAMLSDVLDICLL